MKKIFLSKPINLDLGLLLLRVVFGGVMASIHGWSKLVSYADKSDQFLSFMGMSPSVSLSLTIFAEFFCSILLVLGLFTRYASIPSIIAMLVAVFVAHADDPFKEAEHAFLYLIAYIVILFTGPGKYSLDAMISSKFEE
jgi:putative oxidoreductase